MTNTLVFLNILTHSTVVQDSRWFTKLDASYSPNHRLQKWPIDPNRNMSNFPINGDWSLNSSDCDVTANIYYFCCCTLESLDHSNTEYFTICDVVTLWFIASISSSTFGIIKKWICRVSTKKFPWFLIGPKSMLILRAWWEKQQFDPAWTGQEKNKNI